MLGPGPPSGIHSQHPAPARRLTPRWQERPCAVCFLSGRRIPASWVRGAQCPGRAGSGGLGCRGGKVVAVVGSPPALSWGLASPLDGRDCSRCFHLVEPVNLLLEKLWSQARDRHHRPDWVEEPSSHSVPWLKASLKGESIHLATSTILIQPRGQQWTVTQGKSSSSAVFQCPMLRACRSELLGCCGG